MWRRTSSTRLPSVNTTRSAIRLVSAIETFTTRQNPTNMSASHGRPVRIRANVPANAADQDVAPRNRMKAVGSVAASPASTCVSQLFTLIASDTSFSRRIVPSEAKAVVITTASAPRMPAKTTARRLLMRLLPIRIPTRMPRSASQVKWSAVLTHSACCSDSG